MLSHVVIFWVALCSSLLSTNYGVANAPCRGRTLIGMHDYADNSPQHHLIGGELARIESFLSFSAGSCT